MVMNSRELSGPERKALVEAISSAYPTTSKLKMMVSYELSRNLDSIAGGSNLEEVVFDLIGKAESEGWLESLICAAINRNPGNISLQAIKNLLFPQPPDEGNPKSFKEDLGHGIFLEMLEIPGGAFLMGSPETESERKNAEGPQHIVILQPFLMGKFLVTQVQYQIIMGENPSRFKGVNKPVECVSWDNAVEFCAKISQRTGKTYRLPSEAEWEYACRAGTTTPFYFGDTITTDLANYNGNYTYGSAPKGQSRKQTTDVDYFPANAFGLYDMHGNVWEWCEDTWHSNYEGAPTKGQPWIDNVNDNYYQYRLLRGGSWFYGSRYCRCASRFRFGPGDTSFNIGFRVVLAPPRA